MREMLLKDVWLGSANAFSVDITDSEELAVDLAETLRMRLFAGRVLLCDVLAADADKPVDWLDQSAVGKVTFKLGVVAADANLKTGMHALELHVFDSNNAEPIIWFSLRGREVQIYVSADIDPPAP